MNSSIVRPTLVSVVIPCYNHGRYLGESVASAVARDAAVEVIVVDDGSTDVAASIARELAGITYIRQENAGLAAARNRGLRAAKGSLVIFLDADDRLEPGGIDAGVRALAANPDCAMAYGRCVMIGPDGEAMPTPQVPTVRCGHYAALLRTNLLWMPAMAIFRRDPLVAAGGFEDGFDGAADYDIYLRIARDHAIHDHGQLVAAYRKHAGSMSASASRMLNDTLTVMLRNRPQLDPSLLAAWEEGYTGWQDFYGTQLMEEIRSDLGSIALWRALAKSLTLVRRAPGVFRRELSQKTRLTFSLAGARATRVP
jgi:glycosyltransferase involved in cell wall biosynthesis